MSTPGKTILSNAVRDLTLSPLAMDSKGNVAMLAIRYDEAPTGATVTALTLHECAELAVSLLETVAHNKAGVDAVPHVRKLLSPLLERD